MVRSALFAVVGVFLTAIPAFAQSASTSPNPVVKAIPKAPPPWTYYMAITTIGIAGLVTVMVVVGFLVQAPGFRKSRSGQAS